MNERPVLPQNGWYPDPAGSGKLRLWDGSQWTMHYSDPPRTRPSAAEFWRPRLSAWRVTIGVAWILAITLVSIVALVDRPRFADVQASAWLGLAVGSVPAVVLAIAVIRTPHIFVITAVASGASSVANSWSTMRNTHSTAAVGVLATPMIALFIVAIGCAIDAAWCARKRNLATRA